MSEELLGINRRGLLVGLTALVGSTMASSVLKGALDYQAGPRGKILSPDRLKIVELAADIIIPDTDTPGAAKAGVHHFIDHMVAKFMSKKESDDFIAGLKAFDAQAGGFLSLSKEGQYDAVKVADDQLHEDSFYTSLKALVVAGYYTSEIGATEELIYDPVPGPYEEMPLAEIGRQWSA